MRPWHHRPAILLALLLIVLAAPATMSPLARAQSSALYFPATGHHLTDNQGFLGFWRAHDGERLLGYPVTETFDAEGQSIQYFTKGRLETQVNPVDGVTEVRVGMVAAEYSVMLFREFPPAPARRTTLNMLTFETTKHTLRAPFWPSGRPKAARRSLARRSASRSGSRPRRASARCSISSAPGSSAPRTWPAPTTRSR